ncbi:MAG: phosphate signaling complex protein PhoU [Acidobacteria bacterium]|nr:phosphate signaling complex protein PhoU [Acidobacteriota bacterium]
MDAPSPLIPHFQDELEQLKARLLVMAGAAEAQVGDAMRALVDRDHALAERVVAGDAVINQLDVEIDERCFQMLALHQPLATDLRVVVSAVKITSDLERIGDFAINIAEATLRYLEHPSLKPLIDIPRMGDIAQTMLSDALDAYVRHDSVLAQQVLERDDALDQLKDQVFRDLIGFMSSDGQVTQPPLDLFLISRHLERIGDHATNIAEEAIFIVSGRDVRHHGREGGAPDV